jgi:acetylglutamate kinase
VKSAVLKFGGEVVADAAALEATLDDVAALTADGWRLVLVHGAGPQMARVSADAGLEVQMVAGQRVTDAATLQVVKQVLGGAVGIDVVAAAVAKGVRAVGCSGVSDAVLSARRRRVAPVAQGGDTPVDYGLVGDIVEVRTELLRHLWAGGFVPVLHPLGVAREGADAGQVYNINADTAAAAVGAALQVAHLVLITAVGGVRRDRDDPSTTIAKLTANEAEAAIADGTIGGGMIPKVTEALRHLSRGVKAVHIVGPGPGWVREAVEQPGRHGTVLVPDTSC